VALRYLFFDTSKAERELGYVLRPFDETLRDTVRDLLDRGRYPARTPTLVQLASPGLVTA
jgi:dihydroflavonol-4-reductase